MNFNKSIADRLKGLRLSADVTQATLADLLSITLQCYQAYEQERAVPPLPVLIKICEFYSLSLDEFVTGAAPDKSKVLRAYQGLTIEKRWIVDFILNI